MVELLAPAGNMERFLMAIHYGADAVYLGGKQFGLRAFSNNFDIPEIEKAVKIANELHKKVFVTVNIFARNNDFAEIIEYVKTLEKIGVHGVIVSDAGVISVIKQNTNLEIHLSTQANTTNKYTVKFWGEQGVKRVVLARELSFNEIKEIKEFVGDSVELEVFVHGAMCISYSGRCLLSNYLTDRDSNKGECVQACRWEYEINEINRKNEKLTLVEDNRGSYILNSKDLNLLCYLKDLMDIGVASFKIEGRMKSPYYVATVVNAYRRAIDSINNGTFDDKMKETLYNEVKKTSHRKFTTAYFLGENNETQCFETSKPVQEYDYIANVLENSNDGYALVEQRNRFKIGDELEILSNTDSFNKRVVIEDILDEKRERVKDAKLVQQKLYVKTALKLTKNDILRKENK